MTEESRYITRGLTQQQNAEPRFIPPTRHYSIWANRRRWNLTFESPMFAPKRKDTLESEIQRRIIKRYEADGYIVVKISLCSRNGFPDLMLLKEGKASFVEVKRSGQKPRPLQEYRLKELRDAGFEAFVLTE